MEVFYLSKLCKFIRDIFLCCLFVHIGDQYNPTFNGSRGSCIVLDMRRFNPVVSGLCGDCAIVSACRVLEPPASPPYSAAISDFVDIHFTMCVFEMNIDEVAKGGGVRR
jgi:hypothetical protein